MAQTTVYSAPGCIKCNSTKAFLKKNSVDFVEVNIREDADAEKHVYDIIEKNPSLGTSLPIVESGTMVFSGYRPEKLKTLANKNAA